MAAGAFIAADWGTSNLRAWRVDGAGRMQASAEFPLGVSRLAPGEAAARFEAEVRPALGGEGLPALLCGMIGSTLGWTLAPYVDCPASLNRLAAGLVEAAPGVRIVPGVRGPGLIGPDVMRGEETQVLGWLAADAARGLGRRLLCLPGTHAKWVRLEAGVVTRFTTAMTGELYELLGTHSILRFAAGVDDDEDAFDRGVAAAGDGSALAARLFGVRGLTLGGALASGSTASFLSGLLIGAEAAALLPVMRDDGAEPVDLVGEARLCGLYGRVLDRLGVAHCTIDGARASLAGLTHIWSVAA